MNPNQSANRRRWEWEKIATVGGTILTFLALLFSIYQNSVSDKRYLENESDNNKELKRIHDRDSLQSSRDNIQINTLIGEYRLQREEAKRKGVVDSINIRNYSKQIALLNDQLKLYNKSIDIQNKNFDDQRKTNQAYLFFSVDLLPDKFIPLTNQFQTDVVHITPVLSITNASNSVAEDITFDLLLIKFDNWTKAIGSVVKTNDRSRSVFLRPDASRILGGPFIFEAKTNLDPERTAIRSAAFKVLYDLRDNNLLFKNNNNDKETIRKRNEFNKTYEVKDDSIRRKYPTDIYYYYIATKVAYRDKYQDELKYIYSIGKVTYRQPYFGRGSGTAKEFDRDIRLVPLAISELELLKKSIVENKFDFERIYKIVEGNNVGY